MVGWRGSGLVGCCLVKWIEVGQISKDFEIFRDVTFSYVIVLNNF